MGLYGLINWIINNADVTICERKALDNDLFETGEIECEYIIRFNSIHFSIFHSNVAIKKNILIQKIKEKFLQKNIHILDQIRQEISTLQTALNRKIPLRLTSIFDQESFHNHQSHFEFDFQKNCMAREKINDELILHSPYSASYNGSIHDHENIRWMIIHSYKKFWLAA